MKQIFSKEELEALIENETIAVIYYSNETCSVCKTLKPKIQELLSESYPKVKLIYVDLEKNPIISGQYRVFSIPTIDIFIEGKEQARLSRNDGLSDFRHAIQRPYDMLFNE